MVRIFRVFLAFVLLGATPAYPTLSLPQNWTQQPQSSNQSSSFVGEWQRPPERGEQLRFPARVTYYATTGESYADAVSHWRKLISCTTDGDDQLLRTINICGFTVDRDEDCNGLTVHRFVRLANLGPPEMMAQTVIYVPMKDGSYEITYERPATEFTSDGIAERDDDVLTDIHQWCDDVAATEGYAPPPSPTSSPTPTASAATVFTVPTGWVRVPNDNAVMVWRAATSSTNRQDIRLAKASADPSFVGGSGVQKVKQMMTMMAYASADVESVKVCKGTQPAIRSIAKGTYGRTMMEQVVVEGLHTGATLTYEIPDGVPDPAAENALLSVCWP